MHSIKKDDSKMSQNTHKREREQAWEKDREREAKTKNSRFEGFFFGCEEVWVRPGTNENAQKYLKIS